MRLMGKFASFQSRETRKQDAMEAINFIYFGEETTKPHQAYPLSQGFDLMAAENCLIEKGKQAFVDTRVSISLPPSFFAATHGPSHLTDIRAIVKGSVYDSSFTGTIQVLIENNGANDLPIAVGDKVAVLIVSPIDAPTIRITRVSKINLNF